jgi:recombination protein RecA
MSEARDLILEAVRPRTVVVDRSTRTGIVSLDLALGGSLPVGAIEIFGEDSVGKSSLIFQILAYAQMTGYQTALAAGEYLDIPLMRDLGVSLDNLLLFRGYGHWVADALLDFQRMAARLRKPVVIAIDSITALRPDHEQTGEWLELVHQYLNEAVTTLPTGSAILVVSQVRARKSVDPRRTFAGGVETSLKRFSDRFTARMELMREDVEDSRYTLVINMLANVLRPSFFMVRLPFTKGGGVYRPLDLVRVAQQAGVVERAGAWLSYRERQWQGEAAAAAALEEDEELCSELRQIVMTMAGY